MQLLKTGLYDFHVKHGAKMVPFAGYSMPLSYGTVGQVTAHNHVRNSVGLFDVGHMVQSFIRGPTAPAFLEWITPSGFASLGHFSSQLSVILNDKGGIIDDTVICRHDDTTYYVVTNAGRRAEDLAWFKEKIDEWNTEKGGKDGKIEIEVLDGQGLVALQGPEAPAVLQQLTKYDLTELPFGKSTYADIVGVRCHIARGGYTGEDGFEISIPAEHTVGLTEALFTGPVALTGLGARDSLRLEAGMCLYGHDLNEDITPIEAALAWVIPKARRETGGFIGAENVLKQLKGSLKDGPLRRRVGMIVDDAPAREGAKILSRDGGNIGTVTSGIPSPTLGKNIAMGYVDSGFYKKGTSVQVEIRKQLRSATITPMPFVPTKYYRGKGIQSP
ncbi:glycine cleavage system T protein [Calocera cornea HHB12733]|uniref:Aminomethyltransferase n=1 Tax=Calocera cornea HHB12733 TaxID=1353952 RepID=A0A165DJ56_9BASI|nr:glycine cleavage system T protein [Calocera cornea HHB12733]